jgi:predicted metal-dependent hydrolase
MLPIPTYTLKHRLGTRRIRLTVRSNGQVIVTAPRKAPKDMIDTFVAEQSMWIEATKQKLAAKRTAIPTPPGMQTSYIACKGRALKLVKERIAVYNTHYRVSVGRVSVKNHSSKWGSCSSKGNLNFNYRILFLPLPLVDYIVVHELCHRKEMNHSKAFWSLVKETVPYHVARRKELRKFHW